VPSVAPPAKVFGANIRRERVRSGLTQEKLAELADLNVRTVQKIEAGSIVILLTTIVRIQTALGCEWADLFTGLGKAKR
jgi:transcriptional regulator with XRE-family HTH domain